MITSRLEKESRSWGAKALPALYLPAWIQRQHEFWNCAWVVEGVVLRGSFLVHRAYETKWGINSLFFSPSSATRQALLLKLTLWWLCRHLKFWGRELFSLTRENNYLLLSFFIFIFCSLAPETNLQKLHDFIARGSGVEDWKCGGTGVLGFTGNSRKGSHNVTCTLEATPEPYSIPPKDLKT